MAGQSQVLNETHLAQINTALEHIKTGMAEAELATRAGIDVAPQVEQMKSAEQRLIQIKQVYFPGQ